MGNKVNILGVKVDKVNISDVVRKIIKYTDSDDKRVIYTPNSEMIMQAYRDEKFKNVLNSADVITADGIGVVYASKILKNPISERCSGYDIACELLRHLEKNGKSLYLFGSKPGVPETAKVNMIKKHPKLNVVGVSNGYFDEKREQEIINDINEKCPDVVFVCLGVPKQEHWIYNHKDELNAKVLIGLGGTLDVFAGNVKRAPDIFIKLGLEWFYRLIKEPWRFKRMLELPKFGMTVFLKGRKYEQ